MTKRILVEYDRHRDNYLPACENAKLICLMKNTTKLTDEDLWTLHCVGINHKVTDYNLPPEHFKACKDELFYPTMRINYSIEGFICWHMGAKGKLHKEPIIIKVRTIDEAFMQMYKDPNKPKNQDYENQKQ